MSQPPKSTILAPRARWVSLRMVFCVMAAGNAVGKPGIIPRRRQNCLRLHVPRRLDAMRHRTFRVSLPSTAVPDKRDSGAEGLLDRFDLQAHAFHPDDTHGCSRGQVRTADVPE